MSKLLIDENPLMFQPALATAIGINEAIVLQQIHYWITNPNNAGYESNGFKWVYNTYKEWRKDNFPFWSENTIQRVFTSLEEKGLVIAIQPMKHKYDHTKYYRIDYSKLDAIDGTNIDDTDDTKLGSSTNTETTSETTSPAPDFKKRTEDALFRGIAERQNLITVGLSQHDISDWPEEVRPTLKAVCEQWGLVPPAFRNTDPKMKSKGRGAFWLTSLREINAACAEFTATEVLIAVREDFVRHMEQHGGLAPFTVSGPSSLVNVAAAKAGTMRTASQVTTEPPRKEFPKFDEHGRAILE